MKTAIIKLGGKQIQVNEGAKFNIERQSDLSNINVLFYSDEDKILIGTPTLGDIEVKASIEGEERAKKVRVARFKSKSRYRKVKGHRQPLSVVKIESINLKGSKSKTTKKKEEKKASKTVSASTSKKSSSKK